MASDPDGTDGDWVGVSLREGREWVLLDGHRFVVAGLVTVGFLAFVTAISVSRLAPLRRVQPFFYLFSGLLGGNITLVTVVVAINQLLLSRELNRPGDLRSQIEATVEFRQDVGDEVGRAPGQPPRGSSASSPRTHGSRHGRSGRWRNVTPTRRSPRRSATSSPG